MNQLAHEPKSQSRPARVSAGLLLFAAIGASILAGCRQTDRHEQRVPDVVPNGVAVRGSETPLTPKENIDWNLVDPLRFLDRLATNPDVPFTVWNRPPAGWIRSEHLPALMEKIHSKEPAAPVVSSLSSYYPFDEKSTVGREAMFLIEGYRTQRYPSRLSSLYYFDPDTAEVESWWSRGGRIESR